MAIASFLLAGNFQVIRNGGIAFTSSTLQYPVFTPGSEPLGQLLLVLWLFGTPEWMDEVLEQTRAQPAGWAKARGPES